MRYKWNSSPHPISDIRDWSKRKILEVRPDYQRKEVWSSSGKVMLIDSIIKNIPIPKIFLEAIIKDDETYRIVIDGQQRISAILGFLRGDFKLDKPYAGEHLGLYYNDLSKDLKDEILSYKIDFNEILNPTEAIVREIYSRVNRYTVPLNKQEMRRADFPGDFLSVAQELADSPIFEDSRIFSIAARRRMGDVEFVSELLAMLIHGIQDKQKTLDDFYQDFSVWEKGGKAEVVNRFSVVINDILMIFDTKAFDISKTRFKQKSDFYSLFYAIDRCRTEGGSLDGRNFDPLREDLKTLDKFIMPESDVDLFSEYAVKCISQSNTIASRTWRGQFLYRIIKGAYELRATNQNRLKFIKKLVCEINDSPSNGNRLKCALCSKTVKENELNLSWSKEETQFHLSNIVTSHTQCNVASMDIKKGKNRVH